MKNSKKWPLPANEGKPNSAVTAGTPPVGHVEIMGRRFTTKAVVRSLIWAPLAIWLVWATVGVRFIIWVVDQLFGSTEFNILQNAGQAGDLFGGVNALFAAYAFTGVAIAAYYQHKTFKVVEEQQAQQAFEPLFFKLLELNREQFRPTRLWGKDFRTAVPEFAVRVLDPLERGDFLRQGSAAARQHVAKAYNHFYAGAEGELGPFFRTLFQLFKLIDESKLSKATRIQYANIARASLSRDEVVLLMLNCVTSRGRDFKPLVEKYGLLKHLPVMPRAYRRFAGRMFAPTAVMDSKNREKFWRENPGYRPANMKSETISLSTDGAA